jgi:hypothetical protein
MMAKTQSMISKLSEVLEKHKEERKQDQSRKQCKLGTTKGFCQFPWESLLSTHQSNWKDAKKNLQTQAL